MGIIDKYGYSKENPPHSCMECAWNRITYEPAEQWYKDPSLSFHTLYYDKCNNTNQYFGKMHIILRGEFRSLKKHDEDDLGRNLPYECPFFNMDRVFWERFGVIQMDWEMFIYECAMHPADYYGHWVYALPEIVQNLKAEIPPILGLIYIDVEVNDRSWFIETFGDRTVLITDQNPYSYVIPPLKPVDE